MTSKERTQTANTINIMSPDHRQQHSKLPATFRVRFGPGFPTLAPEIPVTSQKAHKSQIYSCLNNSLQNINSTWWRTEWITTCRPTGALQPRCHGNFIQSPIPPVSLVMEGGSASPVAVTTVMQQSSHNQKNPKRICSWTTWIIVVGMPPTVK